MAYSDDEIKRNLKTQRRRKDSPPLAEVSEANKLALLERLIEKLLLETNDKDYLLKEVQRLTARCGLRMEREQRENLIRHFDRVQRMKRGR